MKKILSLFGRKVNTLNHPQLEYHKILEERKKAFKASQNE